MGGFKVVPNLGRGLSASVPAVVPVDGSARVQTLTKRDNKAFYDLIRRFYEKTGVPMVLNTSFNIAGEPLVETPDDALWCLLSTGLDAYVIEGNIVKKKTLFSLLDLYPQLIPNSIKVMINLMDFSRGRYSEQNDYIVAICRTPWEDFEQFFPWFVTQILERIDGTASARTTLAELLDNETVTEHAFTGDLLQLSHAGLIRLTEIPS